MLGSHRDNAHFSRAGWKKRVILPCWIIQVLILLSLMGLFSYRLSHTVNTWKEKEDRGDVPIIEFIWAIANIGFSLISLVVTFVSIARFIAEVLTPLPLLFGCILNLVLSGAVLSLDIVIYVQRSDMHYSLTGLGLDIALIFFTIIPFIYSIIIYRRLLNYDDYHLPGNHKPFGFTGVEEGVEDRLSTQLNTPISPYDPTGLTIGTHTIVTGGEPQTRGRSVSLGSRRISLSFSGTAGASPNHSPPLEARHERRTSYDHKRDTQFEAYVARRASQSQSFNSRRSYPDGVSPQDDGRRALGFDFGFSDLPPPTEPARANMKGETVSVGAVHAMQVPRPRVNSVGERQASYEVIVGATNGMCPMLTVTTPPEDTLRRGRSLNSVPESHEEDHYVRHPSRYPSARFPARKRAASESHQALLGGGGEPASPPRMDPVNDFDSFELESRTRRRDP